MTYICTSPKNSGDAVALGWGHGDFCSIVLANGVRINLGIGALLFVHSDRMSPPIIESGGGCSRDHSAESIR